MLSFIVGALGFTVCGKLTSTFGQSLPNRFIISGIVLDQSGASIPDATVQLRKTGNSPEQTIVTDKTGAFRFVPVPPGRYEVYVRRESFKPGTLRVVVRDRDLTSLRIVLPIVELREVVVASGQAEQVNTNPGENLDVVSLDHKALSDLPVLDQDVIGAVSAFLDSSALGSGGATLVVNGMETSEKGVSASAIKEKLTRTLIPPSSRDQGAGASKLSPRLRPMRIMGPSTSCFAIITWMRAMHLPRRGLLSSGEYLKVILPDLCGREHLLLVVFP
ncbi:MAG TPA: carboxypeptidase-like regulatory domain-containing protein [Acidobacteriota bacterium]|nr:carboxypeptidase-like regulatory domain-containing protein [Acidobacteriota bacterium]